MDLFYTSLNENHHLKVNGPFGWRLLLRVKRGFLAIGGGVGGGGVGLVDLFLARVRLFLLEQRFVFFARGQVDAILLFPLHSPVLVPSFDLELRETQFCGETNAVGGREVLLDVELALQSQQLPLGEHLHNSV